MMTNKTNFIVARHGQTNWNLEKRYQGHTNIPLNTVGHQQAVLLVNKLASVPIHSIYSSDLSRALDTARHVANDRTLVPHAQINLRERFYGQFEGLTREEMKQQFPQLYDEWHNSHDEAAPPNGEALVALRARIRCALKEIATKHPNQTVLIVTHGGVMDAIHWCATGTSYRATSTQPKRIPNAEPVWLSWQNQQLKIEQWFDKT